MSLIFIHTGTAAELSARPPPEMSSLRDRKETEPITWVLITGPEVNGPPVWSQGPLNQMGWDKKAMTPYVVHQNESYFRGLTGSVKEHEPSDSDCRIAASEMTLEKQEGGFDCGVHHAGGKAMSHQVVFGVISTCIPQVGGSGVLGSSGIAACHEETQKEMKPGIAN